MRYLIVDQLILVYLNDDWVWFLFLWALYSKQFVLQLNLLFCFLWDKVISELFNQLIGIHGLFFIFLIFCVQFRYINILLIFSIELKLVFLQVSSDIPDWILFDLPILLLVFDRLDLKLEPVLLIEASLGNKNNKSVDHPGNNNANKYTLNCQASNRSGILLVSWLRCYGISKQHWFKSNKK